MCLDYVELNTEKEAKKYCDKKLRTVIYKNQKWYVGWKTIQKTHSQLVFLYYGSILLDKISLSTAKYTVNGKLNTNLNNGTSYKVGFHIFKTRNGARNYGIANKKVVKVLFQKPLCVGRQICEDVIVANKIIVLNKIRIDK